MDGTNLERKCLDLANNLLTKYASNLNSVSNVNDINSELIVLLFEHITNHNIPDLLANETNEAEAHNVQAVIDTLSLDLLGISLSHITGEDVMAGNLVTIYNLLEVLEGLATYLKSKKQVKRQNCMIKRKINRKKKSSSSSSVKSLISLLQDSPDIESITQIECTVKKKIRTGEKSSSSTSLKSLVSFHQGSPAQSQVKKSSDVLSSTSNASLPIHTKPQTSDTSKSKSKNLISLKPGIQVHSSTSEKYPTQEYTNIKIGISSPILSQCEVLNLDTKLKPHFEGEDRHLQAATSEDQHSRIQSSSQMEKVSTQKNNIPTKEMVDFSKRNMKRKMCRHPKNENSEHSSNNSQEVEELYEKNFENRIRGLLQKSYKTRASHMKNMHLQSLRRPLKRSPISACKKSFLLPHTLRRRSIVHKSLKRKASQRSNLNPNILDFKENISQTEMPKEGFIQELFDEFPELQLTPTIINHITNKYQQHLLKMHKQVKDILLKKPKSQRQAEEAAKKQSLLDNILKKDIRQQQHLIEIKEHKKFENKIKYQLRDARLQSAKMKQYCDEFRTEMRKKVQKRNFSEELVFENLFKESLKIQKEQVDSLCQEVKETGENDARQHLIYLDALENLYQTQFSLLSESFAAEKKEARVRAKAEQQDMNVMQQEFQEELKQEIRFMQQVIVDCMEDIHFREMDAERFKAKLQRRH